MCAPLTNYLFYSVDVFWGPFFLLNPLGLFEGILNIRAFFLALSMGDEETNRPDGGYFLGTPMTVEDANTPNVPKLSPQTDFGDFWVEFGLSSLKGNRRNTTSD